MASPRHGSPEYAFAALLAIGSTAALFGMSYSEDIAAALTRDAQNPILFTDYEQYANEEVAADLVETGCNAIAVFCVTAASALVIKQVRHELE